MTINDREILTVRYSTEENWYRKMPTSNWLLYLLTTTGTKIFRQEVIGKIINNDVCYVCTIGHSCEMTHDLVDEKLPLETLTLKCNIYQSIIL